ncbi:hypothetical protein NN561_003722 [Cricetulus griseus]
MTYLKYSRKEKVSAKFVHGVPSSTPHSAPPHTTTSPKLPPVLARSPGTPAPSSPDAHGQNRGSEKLRPTPPPLYATTLPSINTPTPGRAPGLRAGARPGDRRDRDCGVQEGDRQTSLRELLSCV